MTRPFDDLMTALDAPMTVVTTAAGGERAGCVVGFHTQCSIHPGRFAVWLSKANHTYRVGLRAQRFAVHFLAEGDVDLVERFGTVSGDDVDKFAAGGWSEGPDGVPLLDGCPNRMVVRKVALLDEGSDHVCVITEPESVDAPGRFSPLRLSAVGHLDPGHDVDERPHPPTERSA